MSRLTLLQLLTLCFVIQVTSSQPTDDVTIQNNDVSSCGQNDQILSVLNRLLTANSQLQTDMSRLETCVTELLADVAELKTPTIQKKQNRYVEKSDG